MLRPHFPIYLHNPHVIGLSKFHVQIPSSRVALIDKVDFKQRKR